MIRRLALAAVAPVVAAVTARPLLDRLARRILDAPRRLPGEDTMKPALDALGGELVRIRSRDGLRLSARWLPAEPGEPAAPAAPAEPAERATREPAGAAWAPDPHEAILLLHGYSGSVAPDLLEYGPFLRRTANVLGLDFRGHGDSDDAPTTFGMLEVEDVAGALAWLGERGIRRVALFGTSMGGITAIASVGVLGDGRFASPDLDPDAPAASIDPPRPQVVAVVADSVAPTLAVVVGSRMRFPFSRALAARAFGRAGGILGGDPRDTEPIRVIGLLEDVPLLLVHGTADRTVPIRDGRRLVAAAPQGARHVVIEGADHAGGHRHDPAGYERVVETFLRSALRDARAGMGDGPDGVRILTRDTPPEDAPSDASGGATG